MLALVILEIRVADYWVDHLGVHRRILIYFGE
jgi:L-rhamnose isomerase